MIEGAVLDALLRDAAVQAATQGRVGPDKALQKDVPPYLVVLWNSTRNTKTFGGQAGAANDAVTLEVYGRNKAECLRAARAADAVMVGDPAQGTKGLAGFRSGRWKVQGCFSDDANAGHIPNPHADDKGRFFTALDYTVHYAPAGSGDAGVGLPAVPANAWLDEAGAAWVDGTGAYWTTS